MLGVVVGVPQFGGDPEVVAFDISSLQGVGESLARLGLIAVIAGAVEMSITTFNRCSNDSGGFGGVNLPKSKSYRIDFSTTGQSDAFHTYDA